MSGSLSSETSPTTPSSATQSGAALAGFTVAVSHRSKKDGAWQDVPDGFFRCTAWRSVAENASRTLKGMRVFVAGLEMQGYKACFDEINALVARDGLFFLHQLRGPGPLRFCGREAGEVYRAFWSCEGCRHWIEV